MDKKLLKKLDNHFMAYYNPYYDYLKLDPKDKNLKLKLVKSNIPDTLSWNKNGFNPKLFDSKEFDEFVKNPIKDLLEEPKVIGDGLFDKLLSLAARKKRSSHDTRKVRKKRKNKTRRK